MFWFTKPKSTKRIKQDAMIHDSQKALIEAAKETTGAAIELAEMLKIKAEDTEKQLKTTSNLVQDVIIATDSNGIITSANNAACRLLNQPERIILGTYISSYFDISNDMAKTHEIISSRCSIILKSDTTIKLAAAISESPKLEGTITYVLLIKDVGFEHQLAEIKIKYETIKNSNLIAIFVLDTNYNIIETNQEARNIIKYYDIQFTSNLINQTSITFLNKEYNLSKTDIAHNNKSCYVLLMSPLCDC